MVRRARPAEGVRRGPRRRDVALLNVVLDWDGTVTVRDSLVQVLERFGDMELFARLEPRVGHDLTLHEEIALEFEAVRAPLEEVVDWVLKNVRVRAGFAELARTHRPLVVSAGFHELIEPVLAREGVEGLVHVQANRVEARRDGWRVLWRDDAACGTCSEPCKRAALPDDDVVYVGDGYSDRCAALAADRVFARDGLARYLDGRGVAYERFEDLRDVSVVLESAAER